MKVEIINETCQPLGIKSLFDYFQSVSDYTKWIYFGLTVELDPTFDFKGNNALIRWTDIHEGFNDKFIVNSLEEFLNHFQLLDA